MCGIFFYLTTDGITSSKVKKSFRKIQSRGPDKSKLYQIELGGDVTIFLGFHRLRINDLSEKGDQPFHYQEGKRDIYMVCNGEIYNYKTLIEEYKLTTTSTSDCSVIIPLYLKFGLGGFFPMVTKLRGQFAIILLDIQEDKVLLYTARDQFGVSPLFYATEQTTTSYSVGFASQLRALNELFKSPVQPVQSGDWFSGSINETSIDGSFLSFYKHEYPKLGLVVPTTREDIHGMIRKLLFDSVEDRLMADAPVGFLLSGGVDSSLICGIANYILKKRDPNARLRTFTTGMQGGTDYKFAKMVADHIGSDHKEVYFTIEEGLKMIPEVVYANETYDITTIRASIPQHMVSQYISKNTDIKVILNGDGSDEVVGGYLMFHNAPNEKEFHDVCTRLVKEIHLYDVLRVYASLAYYGLEPRVPFLDHRFVDFYMSLPASIRMPQEVNGKKLEKALLRQAFADMNLIPREVLFRIKEALSDGISSQSKSWYQHIQEYTNKLITDKELDTEKKNYTHLPPVSKESLFYRKLFEREFSKINDKYLEHYWLHAWSVSLEPSARAQEVYKKLEQSDEKKA
jgi:asparagine synthase (glutamine-hydrolysing)